MCREERLSLVDEHFSLCANFRGLQRVETMDVTYVSALTRNTPFFIWRVFQAA